MRLKTVVPSTPVNVAVPLAFAVAPVIESRIAYHGGPNAVGALSLGVVLKV
ncbi:MAG TPA: hypothetical protein VGG24_17505 [Paraburkholderia sp.]